MPGSCNNMGVGGIVVMAYQEENGVGKAHTKYLEKDIRGRSVTSEICSCILPCISAKDRDKNPMRHNGCS